MKEVKKTMNAVKGFILPQCLVRRLSRHLLIGAQCAPNVMSAEQRVVAASLLHITTTPPEILGICISLYTYASDTE